MLIKFVLNEIFKDILLCIIAGVRPFVNIGINDITGGIALRVEDKIYIVADYNHVKPGKGSAFVRVRLRDIKTDLVIERTYRSSENLETVSLEEKKVQYSYKSNDTYYFMDQESFDEITVPQESVGSAVDFLQDNLVVTAVFCDNKFQKILLPNFMIVQIIETEQGIKGDSSKSSGKPAKIDTGATVLVPLFVNVGDWVKIDTREGGGKYVERVQK